MNRKSKSIKNIYGKISKFLCISLFIFAALCFILINGLSTPCESSTNIMTSKEVKIGMKGYGLTVFKGTKIESFPVVVIGKLKKHLGGADLILVRVLGGYPVEHKTGIIAGMSGSPVYINGKLIGAIGYGWAFSKEPIGGVTPIENMLTTFKIKNTSLKVNPDREYFLSSPINASDKKYNKILVSDSCIPQKETSDTMILTPVASMIQVSGFSKITIDMMREKLKSYGITPIAIPGGYEKNKNDIPPLEPGSAVGITFLKGDLNIGGTGTVTYRNGNRILAFGHPALQLGSIDIPMNAAYIEGVLPSLFRPFKFSSNMGIIGTLQQDRLYAVGGTVGPKAPMIPVTIGVNEIGRNKKIYKLEVLKHKYLTPWILTFAGFESLTPSTSFLKDCSAKIHYSIKLKGYQKLEFDDWVAGNDIHSAAGIQMMSYIKNLTLTKFTSPKLEKVDINIKLLSYDNTLVIKDVSTQYKRVKPGDIIKVSVRLKDRKNKTHVKKLKIPIPSDIGKGIIKIAAAGGADMPIVRKKLRVLRGKPENIKQVVDRIRRKERSNDLVIQAVFPRRTVVFAGDRLENLPISKQSIFVSSPRSSTKQSLDSHKSVLKMPGNIEGFGEIVIRVSKKVPASQDAFETEGYNNYNSDAPDKIIDSTMSMSFGDISKILRERRFKELVNLDIPLVPVASTSKVKITKKVKAKKTKKSKKKKTTVSKRPMPTGTFKALISSPQDLFQGQFKNTSITNGNVILGHKLKSLYNSGQSFIMDLTYDNSSKTFYAVESPSGHLVKIKEGRNTKIIGKTGEILTPCIAKDKSGNLYIGTGPYGRIYQKKPGHKIKLFCTLPDDIIWDIAIEPSGNLLVGTGNSGKLYRISPSGKAKVIFNPPEFHVTSLKLIPDRTVFIGCANEGTIYKMTPNGKINSFYRTLGQSIDAMVYENRNLWIASDELLYKVNIDEKKGRKIFIFPESAIISLAKDSLGNILVGTSDLGRIYRFENGDFENLYESHVNQVMAIHPLNNGDLVVSTGNPGKVVKVKNSYASKGYYFSKVIDTGGMSNFGKIRWIAEKPISTNISIQTRTGYTSTIDKTWSKWSSPYSSQKGEKVKSPTARYIQFKATLRSNSKNKTPSLFSAEIYYRRQATGPIMQFSKPKGGENLAKGYKIQWKAFSTRPESLSYNIFSSGNNGKTWKPIKYNLEAKIKPSKRKTSRNKILKESYNWMTRTVKDGIYILKIIGFDRTDIDNPYLTSEVISKPFYVCNKNPKAAITRAISEKNRALLYGLAKSKLVNIREVSYKIGKSKKWHVAFPKDGIFDSNREQFIIYLNKPYLKKFILKIKVADEAGNFSENAWSIKLKKIGEGEIKKHIIKKAKVKKKNKQKVKK